MIPFKNSNSVSAVVKKVIKLSSVLQTQEVSFKIGYSAYIYNSNIIDVSKSSELFSNNYDIFVFKLKNTYLVEKLSLINLVKNKCKDKVIGYDYYQISNNRYTKIKEEDLKEVGYEYKG